MAKITLARAFVLRGFFRKTITELNQEIRSENLTSEIDDSKSFFKDESTEKAYRVCVMDGTGNQIKRGWRTID